MNIFKILSSNDGSINEPNVTSFLAYLLDLNENHGLESKFLELFLNAFILNYEDIFKNLIYQNRIRDLSKKSEFDIRIQAEFRVNGIKKISRHRDIDILIEIYSNKNKEIPEYAFCIENKINDGAINKGNNQLYEEVVWLKNYYKKIDNENTPIVTLIFLTPKLSKLAISEFNELLGKLKDKNEDNIICEHFIWHKNLEDNKKSISTLLETILEHETFGKIEPIYDYTKHTIKAFLAFINSDFKSYKEEKLEIKQRRNYKKPLVEYISDVCNELNYMEQYEWTDIISSVKKKVKQATGMDVKEGAIDKATIVNERNRIHYSINDPTNKRNNLFYYPLENNKKIVCKLDLDNPPKDIEIFWRNKESENLVGRCLLTEIYPEK